MQGRAKNIGAITAAVLMLVAGALTIYQVYNVVASPSPTNTLSRIDSFVAQHWATKHYGIVLTAGPEQYEDDYFINNPSVIRIDDVYYMYYSGRDRATKTWKVCLATSPDGKSWTKQGPILRPADFHAVGFTDVTEVSQPWVIYSGGTYYMYVMATRSYGGLYRGTIFVATSTDGVSWSIPPAPTNPLITPSLGSAEEDVWSPTVVYFGDTYYMYYLGTDRRVSPTVVRIFVAVANHPLGPWTRLGMITLEGAAGEWDPGPRILGMGAVVIDDVILLAYTAEATLSGYATGATLMGFAFSDDGTTFYRSLFNPIFMRAASYEARFIRDPCPIYEGGRLKIYYGAMGAPPPVIVYAEAVQAATDVRQVFISRIVDVGYTIKSDPICGEYETVKIFFYSTEIGKLYIEIWDEETQTWVRLRWYEYYESLYYTYEYMYNTPNELIVYTIEFTPVRMFRIVFVNLYEAEAVVSAWVTMC